MFHSDMSSEVSASEVSLSQSRLVKSSDKYVRSICVVQSTAMEMKFDISCVTLRLGWFGFAIGDCSIGSRRPLKSSEMRFGGCSSYFSRVIRGTLGGQLRRKSHFKL